MEQIYTTSYLKKKHTCGNFDYAPGTNFSMEKGSIIHEILEKGKDAYSKEGSTYRGQFRAYKYLADHNFAEYEAINDMVREAHADLFTDKWLKERTLNATTSKGHKVSGIVDNMLIQGTEGILIDWKTGRSRADKNVEIDMLQGMMYLYLLFKNYTYVTSGKFTFFYVEGLEFLDITATDKDLPFLELFIEKYIAIANLRGLELNSKCADCKNKGTCPLVADALTKLETLDYQTLKVMAKVIKTKQDEIKDEWLEDEEKKEANFSVSTSYYVKKDELTAEQKEEFFKKEDPHIKVSKAIMMKLKEQGVEIIEQQSSRVKPSAN